MSDLEMWSLIVSFFLPLVIAIAQQPRFHGMLRVIIMVLFCVIAAGVTAALQGNLTASRWFHSLLILAIGTITFYRGVWRPAGTTTHIEYATSSEKKP